MPPRKKTSARPRQDRSDRTRRGVPDELTDKARGVRLQKAMADAGVASRRDCETLIEEGRVRVNGEPVTALPAWIDPAEDRVEVDRQPLPRQKTAKPRQARHHYLMLHKPRGVISTTRDPEGRKTVTQIVNAPFAARLFPVGRLDADSTGLILLTDDGELTNRLTHPRYEVAKQYQVSIRGRLGEEDLEKMRKGLFLASTGKPGQGPAAKRASVDRVRIVGREMDRARGHRTQLEITLREGQNREIRRLLARLGYKVRRLKRVAIGPVRLKGIAPGQWRPLKTPEIRALFREAGLKPRSESEKPRRREEDAKKK
ncbi:MAG: pseudouridine synthase [Phycisphaeraceae bacterium]